MLRIVKMAAKYDLDSEAEVISWFKQLFNVDLEPGMREIESQLRDGQLLVRYQPIIIISSSSSSISSTLPLSIHVVSCVVNIILTPAVHVGTFTL